MFVRALPLLVALVLACGCTSSAASNASSPTPTARYTLSVVNSCTDVVPYVKQALDLGHSDDSPSVGTVDSLAATLRVNLKQAPDVLVSDLTLLASNLEQLGAGTTMTGADFIDPGNRLISACGATYSDPADTEAADDTSEPAEDDETDEPSLSKSEQKYVDEQVYSEPGDDDYDDDVQKALKTGRSVCDKIGDHDRGWSRSRYLYDRESNEQDADDAVKYLCTKFKADLKMSHRTISENSNGDVDDDVRPGTYRSAPKVSDCYWERQTGGGNIIANDFVTHASKGVTVSIRPSDGGFSTQGCGPLYPTATP